MRGALEVAKQSLCCWPGGGRFAPTEFRHSPQCIGETQRLGITWFPGTLPFLYSDYHCIGTEVVKRSEAGQNLAAGKRRVRGECIRSAHLVDDHSEGVAV